MTDKEEMAGEAKKEGSTAPAWLPIAPQFITLLKAGLWLIPTVGIIYLLFFSIHHEFLPQVGWEALIASIIAVSLSGIYISLLLIISPLMPSLFSIDSKQPWVQRRKMFDLSFALGSLIFLASIAFGYHHAKWEWGDWRHPGEKGQWMALVVFAFALCLLALSRLGWCSAHRWKAFRRLHEQGLNIIKKVSNKFIPLMAQRIRYIWNQLATTPHKLIEEPNQRLPNFSNWAWHAIKSLPCIIPWIFRIICPLINALGRPKRYIKPRTTSQTNSTSAWLNFPIQLLYWPTSLLIGSTIAFFSLPEPFWLSLIIYATWLTLMVMANYAIAKRSASMGKIQFFLVVAMPTLILAFSGTLLSSLIDAPIRMLGLGLIDAGRVTVSDKYAGPVERAFGPLSPNPFGSQDAEHVCIVSRIGGEYLMAAGTCENYSNAKGRAEDRPALPARVWLPGEAVLSWSREPVKSAKNSHDDKSVKPVAHANAQASRGN